jgi:lipopolysaccharide assembly protein A
MYLFLFLALLICIVIVLFAVQNAALVTVTFLAFHFAGSLAFILVVVFALGVLSGMLMTVPSFWRKSAALREQRKKVRQLEESAAFKAAPELHGTKEEGAG